MSFSPVGLGLSIFQERYARGPEETWELACERVARAIAAAEENGKAAVYEQRFGDLLKANHFMPGGRIWYGAGRPKQQLLNCFVIPTGDSREQWGKSISDMLVVSGMGGGVGANFSPVRGRGYPVKGTGGVATGSVSLMEMWDKVGDILVSGGGRRLALMLCLDFDHPDIEEFLDKKLDKHLLNNANISVVIPPHISSERFQEMVRNDEQIPLQFNGVEDVFKRSISARALWTAIVQNAWNNGEPGVLNGYEANRTNNVWYHHDLVSTNPCGEIWLPPYGCCDLGALVLPQFVREGHFDFDSFDEAVRLGVRFLDNVLDVNHYPLGEIEVVCRSERRIGLGVMGVHTMLLDMGLGYDSDDGRGFIDRLFRTLKNTAYDASVSLAIEKGVFPAYDRRLLDSGFAKTLKRGIRNKIKEHGLRNCALLTIAPTGTTSMVSGVTGAAEPLLAPVYKRRRKVLDERLGTTSIVETLVVSKEYQKYGDLAVGAYDISPRAHFEMQKIIQSHVDNAVSKTINLPKDFSVDELADLWLEYLPYIKGSTFYREGSREDPENDIWEPMSAVRLDEIPDLMLNWTGEFDMESPQDEQNAMECANGVCEVPQLAV